MRVKTVELFEYDELSEVAKEKARDWFVACDELPFLTGLLNDDASCLLQEAGIKGEFVLFYDLGFSQGDGCVLEGRFEFRGAEFGVAQRGHYVHEKSYVITFSSDDELEVEFRRVLEGVCLALKRRGYAYIANERKREVVEEGIRANGYEFLFDGSFFKY